MARNCCTCGRANADDALFCEGCGARLPATCASCGALLAPDAAFCKTCGAPAAAASAPTAPPPTAAPVPPVVPPAQPVVPPAQPIVPASPQAPVASPPASFAPPPAGPPPGPGAATAPPGGPRKGAPTWLIVVVVLAVIAIAAVAAVFILPLGDLIGGTEATPTPVASTPATSAPVVTRYLAAAVGPRANRLATVDADGSVRELMAFSGREIYQIAHSPDGRWLACVAGTYKRSSVWLFEAGGLAPREVAIEAPGVVAVDSIAWLSAGELLIAGYTATPKSTGENAVLVVYDPSTEAVSPLRDSAGSALSGVSVSASRDGATIAFVTYTDQKTDKYGMPTATERLQVLDRPSGSVTELGSDKAFFDVNSRRFDDPLVSPAGNAIIFRRAGSDVSTSYTVIDVNGRTLMPEKATQLPAGYAWDPGGTKVVFTGHSLEPAENESGIGPAIFWMFDIEAGGEARVVAEYKDTIVQELSWSPDGESIAWAEYDQEKYRTGTIYLTSPTGGDAKVLLDDALTPAWAPGAGAGLQTSPSTSP